MDNLTGYRILIVDDHASNRTYLRDLLTLFFKNTIFDEAENGEEAVEKVKDSISLNYHPPYDLIFMDCHMPEMDGFKVTKEIRALESQHITNNSKNIIVALTANTVKGIKARCKDVGMDDYLSKPLNYSQLCGTLIKYLTSKRDMGQ